MCTLALRTMDPWSSTQWECVCVCVLVALVHAQLASKLFRKNRIKEPFGSLILPKAVWLAESHGRVPGWWLCMHGQNQIWWSLCVTWHFSGQWQWKPCKLTCFCFGKFRDGQMVFICFYSFNGTQARRHCCLAATSCSDIFRSSWSWNPLLQPKDFTSAKIQAKLKRWDLTSQEAMLISSFCMLIPQHDPLKQWKFQCRWRCRMEDRKTHPSHRHPIRVLWPLQKHLEQTNDWMWSGFVANRRMI